MAINADQIIQHIYTVNARRDLALQMGRLDSIQALQEWQCQRLLTTHQDLNAQPEFADAMRFFVDELYGPKDFSQRDKDLTRVIPKLAAVLPEKALRALDDALRLNALSFDLDSAMVEALLQLIDADTLQASAINADLYAQAYRQVNRQAERVEQIAIVEQLGLQLADVVHVRGISLLIKMARKPAELAGVLTLHEFLAEGFSAFKQLGDVRLFLDPIISRETAIMQALLASDFQLKNNPLPQEMA
ncbi:hypothetical protein QTP81_06880 [Alteromonas sp. ASW11-36]|uniref:DUF8198 domain-containing protein n=1 Tax=Alteromonas arenosi TaxID=3055817 RepID=A0ABT7SVX0_9ALTE|nr:hypothetical protein [Alteromonas sp. ASW11-36]MDM7860315.1 hypothetical protein [Alteromonas sp. ASW11-36]